MSRMRTRPKGVHPVSFGLFLLTFGLFPNATGLQDIGVPSQLIVYKGFGHGITKPKETLAANWHNWAWFSKYIWGEDVTLDADKVTVIGGAP